MLRRLAAAFTLLALCGCQKIQEPAPIPTTDQWRRVQENLLDEAPETAHPVGAVFNDAVRLIGWDVEPEEVEVGEDFEITFYWEVLQPLDQRWRIFVHLDSNTRQNLDHETIDGVYTSLNWQVGDIIRDVVPGTLEQGVEPGDVTVLAGLFRDDDRMEVTDPGAGTVTEDGRLAGGSFTASWDPPTYLVRYAGTPVSIDGRPTDAAWRSASSTGNWVNPSNGETAEPGLRSTGKMLWDEEYLYVLMTATDTDIWATMAERDSNLWDEEVLEFYFDGAADGRNYLELQVNPLNTVFDAVFASATERNLEEARAVNIEGLETAVFVSGDIEDRTDRDRSWSAEVRIPWTSLPGFASGPPAPGRRSRVNFYRYDRPEGDSARTAAWSPTGSGTFHRPERFGVATFAAAPRPPTPTDGSGEGSAEEAPIRLQRPQLRPPRNR